MACASQAGEWPQQGRYPCEAVCAEDCVAHCFEANRGDQPEARRTNTQETEEGYGCQKENFLTS